MQVHLHLILFYDRINKCKHTPTLNVGHGRAEGQFAEELKNDDFIKKTRRGGPASHKGPSYIAGVQMLTHLIDKSPW